MNISSNFFLLIILYVIIISIEIIETQREMGNNSVDTRDEAICYLKRYGYLQQKYSNDKITDNLFSKALIKFQKFNKINTTGRFDENVSDIMNEPRCGMPDIQERKSRKKRFSVWGKWRSNEEITWRWLQVADFQKTKQMKIKDFIAEEKVLNEVADRGLHVWSEVCNVRFKHMPRAPKTNIQFNITEIDGRNGDIYGIKWFGRKSEYTLAQIYFDYEDWTQQLLKQALIHTVGHFLGLEHTNVDHSVMRPYGIKYIDDLGEDDIIGVQTLYGINPRTKKSFLKFNPMRADWSKDIPDLCIDSKIDSITETSTGHWLVFKNKHYFELGPIGFTKYSPRRISWDYPEIDGPIDAVLSWTDNVIFFFKGWFYWKYQNKTLMKKKKSISYGFNGIPAQTTFDDVIKWNVNQRTYFFKDDKYWKYDSRTGNVTNGYPKSISQLWKGIPNSFDAAISSGKRNQTYFFKNDLFYRFNDKTKKLADDQNPPYPRETGIWFFKCRNTAFEIKETKETKSSVIEKSSTITMETTVTPKGKKKIIYEENTGLIWTLTISITIFTVIIFVLAFLSIWYYVTKVRSQAIARSAHFIAMTPLNHDSNHPPPIVSAHSPRSESESEQSVLSTDKPIQHRLSQNKRPIPPSNDKKHKENKTSVPKSGASTHKKDVSKPSTSPKNLPSGHQITKL